MLRRWRRQEHQNIEGLKEEVTLNERKRRAVRVAQELREMAIALQNKADELRRELEEEDGS